MSTEMSWEEIKNKKFKVIVTLEERDRLFSELGYVFDEEGNLIDAKTREAVIAEDGGYINRDKDKKVALVPGTHTFIRDSVGYENYLLKKGKLPEISVE